MTTLVDSLIRFGEWLEVGQRGFGFALLMCIFFGGLGYIVKCLKGTK